MPPGSLLDHLKTVRVSNPLLNSFIDILGKQATRPHLMKSIKPSITLSKPRRVRKTIQRDVHMETNVVRDLSIGSAGPTTTAATKPTKRKRNAAESEDLSAAMNLAAAITGANTQYSPTQTAPSHSVSSTLSAAPYSLAPPPTSVTLPSSASTFAPALKKQRQRDSTTLPSRPAVTEIKCRSCQTPDVPLMLGGRRSLPFFFLIVC